MRILIQVDSLDFGGDPKHPQVDFKFEFNESLKLTQAEMVRAAKMVQFILNSCDLDEFLKPPADQRVGGGE